TKDAIPRLLKQKLTKVVGSHRGQGGSPTLKNATSAVVRGVQLVESLIENYDTLDMATKQLLPMKRVYWPA
ncbi:hypothetical protein, partial [Aurantimonas sp. C2-3-R2]|nr:hypothetical protein [Aurantimonas sp. C2-3-R2]